MWLAEKLDWKGLKSYSAFTNSGNVKYRKSHGLHVAINASRNVEIIIYHNVYNTCQQNLPTVHWLSQWTATQTHIATINCFFLPKARRAEQHKLSRFTGDCSFSDLKVLQTNTKDRASA
jgi:hypothetical protein